MSELLNEVKSLVDEFNRDKIRKRLVEFSPQPFIDRIKEVASSGETSVMFRIEDEDLVESVTNYFEEQGFKVRTSYYIYVTIDWSD